MTNTIVKLKNVWRVYDLGKVRVEAVRGVNMDIKKGDFVAIMGPSGSGKTTLLNMIGCLDVPSKGNIYLKNHNIGMMNESNLAMIRGKIIGFIFQTYNLMPTINALDNVELPMIFQDMEKEERMKRAKRLLTDVGLEKRMSHKPTELSGGQQQRVAIARALANKPEILIADEPTGNLDSKSGKEVMNLLSELNKKMETTIILVTHDPNIAKYAKTINIIRDGKINKIIKPSELKKEIIEEIGGNDHEK
ncbi:ABC transporter ATP-binding protein [Candidatus Woesearchaeota archaeon]|nr:ABC transporter ATP-binding protein [Candidatus Woesearchaeota archaeon]